MVTTERACVQCGGAFLMQKRNISQKFCSKKCANIFKDHGKTKESKKIRMSKPYREWRRMVYERDDYTCQECGDRGRPGHEVNLNADHIKPFATHPELRLDINNGKTLCEDCHKKTPTFGRKALNYKKEIAA